MKQLVLAVLTVLAMAAIQAPAGQQTQSRMTRADFINVEGGGLNEKFDRAWKQFKATGQGDSVWIAYHFPARPGSSFGPFSGMVYYDNGIRLERKENPANAAVFLLTDTTEASAKIKRIKTLDLSDPYVFEKRPVYWAGDIPAADSMTFLEAAMRADKENRELARDALRAVASHDHPRVVSILKDLATKETLNDLRIAALSNLARVKSDQSVDALIDLYGSLEQEGLKEEVIRGLSRTDHRRAADKLLAIAKDDPNPKLRRQAVRRLSQSKGEGIWVN
jgi:hypothetical protein